VKATLQVNHDTFYAFSKTLNRKVSFIRETNYLISSYLETAFSN